MLCRKQYVCHRFRRRFLYYLVSSEADIYDSEAGKIRLILYIVLFERFLLISILMSCLLLLTVTMPIFVNYCRVSKTHVCKCICSVRIQACSSSLCAHYTDTACLCHSGYNLFWTIYTRLLHFGLVSPPSSQRTGQLVFGQASYRPSQIIRYILADGPRLRLRARGVHHCRTTREDTCHRRFRGKIYRGADLIV